MDCLLVSRTTARRLVGMIHIYEQMPDQLSIGQQASWRYNRTDKGRDSMKRANNSEKGKAKDLKYKTNNRELLAIRQRKRQHDNDYRAIKTFRKNNIKKIREQDRLAHKEARLLWSEEKKEELKIKNRERQQKYLKTPRGRLVREASLSKENRWQLFKWSNHVRAKYDWKCTDCGSMVNIEAHHIKPKAQFPELMFDLENGIAKCSDCHDKIHHSMRCLT